jgi:hypothetical protein
LVFLSEPPNTGLSILGRGALRQSVAGICDPAAERENLA